MVRKIMNAIAVMALVLAAARPAYADTTYVVQRGDTLFGIALRFGVTVQAIMSANGLTNSNLIFVGQRLTIPTGGSVPSNPTQPPPSNTGSQIYIVQAGDWLSRIAARFGVTVQAIMSANGLTNPNRIFVGQRLVIPGGTSGGNPPATPAPTSAPPVTQPPPSNTGSQIYIVQPGDWLSRIAARFGVTTQAIMTANGLTNPNLIFVGQRLVIPTGGGSVSTPPPAATTPPPSTVTAPPPSGNTGGFELGGHVDSFAFPDKMKYAGMWWVKRQLKWSPGMPASSAQGMIDEAHNKGFKILISVVGGPESIAGGSNYDSYAAFVGEVARLGADGIEVWNESNIDREWPRGEIGGAQYTELLKRAYTAIKNANRNTLVISAGPAPTGAEPAFGSDRVWNDDKYIRSMAAAGAGNYMDCVGVHYNEGVLSPTQTSGDPRNPSNYYTRYYQSMVSLYYNAFGGAKKLCFTELGYLSPEGYGALPGPFAWGADTSVAEQAQWLGEAANIAKNSGIVRLMIVWNVDFTRYDDDPMAGYAIIRPGGGCPACENLRQVTGGR